MQVTVAPAGIVTPWISTSSAGWRMIICTGGEWRSVSANAASISDRSARTAASCSGLATRFMNMFASALSVVSPPATMSNDTNALISRSDICSPSMAAVHSVLSRSAPGVGAALGDDRQHVGLELVLGLQSVGGDLRGHRSGC